MVQKFLEILFCYIDVLSAGIFLLQIIMTTSFVNNFFSNKFNIVFFYVSFFINFFFFLIKFLYFIFFVYSTTSVSTLVSFNLFTLSTITVTLTPYMFLSTALLLLCFITSFVCLLVLGDRNLFLYQNNFFYFSFFLFCTFIMINTTNLLVFYLSFEFIFLPTMYFVYSLGYAKKTDKTIYFLLIWTFCGSFLILTLLLYIYLIYGTLNILVLKTLVFSQYEYLCFFIFIFLGFGVKIPLFPFHFWLTKVHVEAPSGFSIFLSGFLVKTAIFCFGVLFDIFIHPEFKLYGLIFVIFGIIDASIKMWAQLDLKKLIAFATIQEMNLLLLMWLFLNNTHYVILGLFLLMHGILSSLMFFIVDIIQKNAQTRNIQELSGIIHTYPQMKLVVWFMCLMFSGFPFTIKFFIEWSLFYLILTQLNWLGFLCLFLILIFGVIGFFKCWFAIMYGKFVGTTEPTFIVTKFQINILIFLISSLILLLFFLL